MPGGRAAARRRSCLRRQQDPERGDRAVGQPAEHRPFWGKNHVQELVENTTQGAYNGKPAHMIGHLQTNKVKQVGPGSPGALGGFPA